MYHYAIIVTLDRWIITVSIKLTGGFFITDRANSTELISYILYDIVINIFYEPVLFNRYFLVQLYYFIGYAAASQKKDKSK